jgi:curli production assembly/transport component CsgG
MKKTLLALSAAMLLGGCAMIVPVPDPEPPKVVKNENKEFNILPPPVGGPIVAAVYGFNDKTGQRKPSDKLANISFAVTQGAEVWVIKALQEIGGGKWFKVVERVGLDNLTKERQIIRQARDSVGDQRQLKPMMFAGVLIEGGIIGYDSNTLTGGAGARYLGIGPSTQYRQDVVTVTLRAVSVQTGEVLLSVSTTKSIISTGSNLTFFKFFDQGTQSFEAEMGYTVNEPVNYAVRSAIEQAVVELVKEGDRKNYWKIRNANEPSPQPVKQEEVKQDEPRPEAQVKKEEQPPANVPIPPKQTTKGTVIDYSNIRKTKSHSSDKILNLKPGTTVEVLKEENTHYYVGVDGKEGWVARQFIKVHQ